MKLNDIFKVVPTEEDGLFQIQILSPQFFNTELSFKEFAKAFKFSDSAIMKTRPVVLKHLAQFFDFEYLGKRGRGCEASVIIYAQLADYYETPAYQRKMTRLENQQERIEDYWQFIKEEIKREPLNSLARICRAAEKDEYLRSKYKICATTIANNLRATFKARTFKGNPTWVRKSPGDMYIPLTEEEVEYLKYCFREKNLLWQNILTTIGEADAGRIDKEE